MRVFDIQIVCAFLEVKSCARYLTVKIVNCRCLRATSLRVSLNLQLPRDIFQEHEPFFENTHNLHHLHHSFCYAGATLRTSSMVEEHIG